MKIAVVNYEGGNVGSVFRALGFVHQEIKNVEVFLASSSVDINRADRVVIPGQGAMPQTMLALINSGLAEVIINSFGKKPTLGICVGMQILFERGDEGECKGLGLIKGEVNSFAKSFLEQNIKGLKIPQMGWNCVEINSHPLWRGISNSAKFYFAHSFYCQPENTNLCVGKTDYGIKYASAIAMPAFFATQFHPEKSGKDGLKLLKNFIELDF